MEQGRGKVTEGIWEGRDRTWDGTGGNAEEEGEGKGGEGLQPPNFSSWRRHC